jgi:hypothetical protein
MSAETNLEIANLKIKLLICELRVAIANMFVKKMTAKVESMIQEQ